jgi:hypothetical protein
LYLQIIDAFDASVSAIAKAHENSIIIPQISSNFINADLLKDLLDIDLIASEDPRACVFEFKNDAELRRSILDFAVRVLFGDLASMDVHLADLNEFLKEARQCLSQYPVFRNAADIFSSDSLARFSRISVDSWVGRKGAVGILKFSFVVRPSSLESNELRPYLHNYA